MKREEIRYGKAVSGCFDRENHSKDGEETAHAIHQIRDAFTGFAEENGLESEEDVAAMVKEMRSEKN